MNTEQLLSFVVVILCIETMLLLVRFLVKDDQELDDLREENEELKERMKEEKS